MSKDVVQDTFMKLWLHKDNINVEKVRSWLFTTAYHEMLKNIQKKTRFISFDLEIHDIKSSQFIQESNDSKELIDKSLAMLNNEQKSIVILRDIEGYDYKQIGDILDLNEAQVKVYLFRARQKLRDSITELEQTK